MWKNRRKAREKILKTLYRLEFINNTDGEIFNSELNFRDQEGFIRAIVTGTRDKLTQIDDLIESYARGWSVDRLSPVDRNILRMSIFELFFYCETPTEVVINEAVELCKKFGTDQSPSFVNAILDRLVKDKLST